MQQINKPTLVVDINKCRRNIQNMTSKAKANNVAFRPHFKTHQSETIGNLFKEAGVTRITVSSVDMAMQFASQDWNDITIAFPVNTLQINEINSLAIKINMNLVVENVEAIQVLNAKLKTNVNILLKIDVGYSRTGIKHNNTKLIETLIYELDKSPKLNFIGFLSHFGNSYNANSTNEIEQIYKVSIRRLSKLKQNYPNAYISIGDTPSCSIIESFEGANEIRPGNFVYYDVFQMNLGSCSLDQIALYMACPIVSIHKDRSEAIIHGGAVHFSKDSLNMDEHGITYGLIASCGNKLQLIEGAYLKKISQEHGTIYGPKEWISECKVGDLVSIIPIHSCLTANLMKENTIFV